MFLVLLDLLLYYSYDDLRDHYEDKAGINHFTKNG